MLVLGLWPGKTHGTKQSDSLLVNMLLEDFVSLSNLTTVFTLDELADQRALARILACFSILLLGADALTPTIIKRVWGANAVVHCNLGGSHGNLAIIIRRLILLACVANNAYHLWLTTTFNGGTIIPSNILQYLPPGIRDILHIITKNDAAIYVREPLHSGHNRFISYDTTYNNTPQIPSHPHPTLKISSSTGTATFFSVVIIPMTPLA